MPLERSTEEILAAHGEAMKNDLWKCRPAKVTAVHPDRMTVDVVVATNNVVFDDLGNVGEEPPLGISDVPLGVLRGGGFLVWVPVQPGDSVLLVFADLSCDVWRAGAGDAAAPGFVGKHGPDSPFALPMVAPDAAALAAPAADPDKIIIGKDGSSAQIRIGTDIELGAPAADAVALASKVNSELHKIQLTLASLAGATFGTPYTAGTVDSTLVKCG